MPIPMAEIQHLVGAPLLGVLLFGSTARGETRDSSDVDLMIVVDAQLPLTRSLYAGWDQSLDKTGSSRLSPHFVHLPGSAEEAGSLWLEAAVDGIVLFDREGAIARLLRAIRRSMAEGKVQRKSAYGHPYWVRRGKEAAHVQ